MSAGREESIDGFETPARSERLARGRDFPFALPRVAGAALTLLLAASLSACEPGVTGGMPDAPPPDALLPLIDMAQQADFAGIDEGPTPDLAITCASVQCATDQHCAVAGGTASCVDNTCADLHCTATEICDDPPGSGAICRSIACTTNADCATQKFCNGTICVDDVCTPGTVTCVGDELHECASDGSGSPVKYTCGSASYFSSMCTTAGADAYCPCEDDWDCPSDTTCDAGRCSGTGKAPTCTLPARPFSTVLPTNEIQWGGTGTAAPNAVGAPFPASSQSCATPLVANLDDDNGDGHIDERDFPEIIFMTYCNSDISSNGIVRAIHGGGPNKGKNYFATCGSTVWHEGDDINMACACASGTGNSTAALAVGDLDNDGVPEIVVPTETAGLLILDNRGQPITASAANQWTGYADPAPSIANLDHLGFAEIVVGKDVFTLAHDANNKLVFVDHFTGALMSGVNGQGPVSCVANVAGDSALEIVAGTSVYRMPTPPAGVLRRADCAVGATDEFCTGKLVVVWDGQTVNGAAKLPNAQRDGFCAVADVLGTDETMAPGPLNPLDGKPEVVLISAGYLVVLSGETGTLRRFVNLAATGQGGAPNVDDFDGDGFPEIGTAFGTQYIVIDLQDPSAACPAWPNALNDAMSGMQGNPARSPGGACTKDSDCAVGAKCNTRLGACTCLYNGWRRVTEDDSSAVTGSSVFDFNGDGAAEVAYNDECYFRIYDGTSGAVLFKHPAPSRTRIENPAIADVDNDGNAEVVISTNNEAAFCSVGNNFPNGIAVWGDASDTWVAARRIWNQHAYHVTNVTEGGRIPEKEPESWRDYNGRSYDTYRSNPRNRYGLAPDLFVGGVQVSSPDAACGKLSTTLAINAEIANGGDLRVGPGVVVTFYGTWKTAGLTEALYADGSGTALTSVITSSLAPGQSVLVSVAYDAAHNSPNALPDEVRVVVDEANNERECMEGNNQSTHAVAAGMQAADLRLTLGAVDSTGCPEPTLPTILFNDGSAPASNVLVRYYAGDPNQGGTAFHDEMVAGPIAAGASQAFTAQLTGFPENLSILVFAVADPANSIVECNDGNNRASAMAVAECSNIK